MEDRMKKEGLFSVIRYEGDNDTFIWKHPIEDFNFGSQLIVHESQEAIFFKDGQALDLFTAGRYTLKTQQLPILGELYRLATNDNIFHSEVYFINKTVQTALKWGTADKVRFIDPLTGVPLEIGASGEMNIQVTDSRKMLVKLVGSMRGISWEDHSGFTKSLQATFRPLISNVIKTNLPAIIKNENIDILEIDSYLNLISDELKEKIIAGFEEYGLTIPQFYVTNVVLPEEDANFRRIKELHMITLKTRIVQAEALVKTAQAQSEAQYRTAEEQSKATIEVAHRETEIQKQITEIEIARREAERKIIEAQTAAQTQRVTGLAEAEIMRAQGYTKKDVLQAEVQKAYAEGIGNMGPEISSGGGNSVVGDMLGLGVGLAAANTMVPQLNGMLQGIQVSPQTANQIGGSGMWDCSCGQTEITGNFCGNCGAKRPDGTMENWNCSCGRTGNTGNFCENCGRKRDEN